MAKEDIDVDAVRLAAEAITRAKARVSAVPKVTGTTREIRPYKPVGLRKGLTVDPTLPVPVKASGASGGDSLPPARPSHDDHASHGHSPSVRHSGGGHGGSGGGGGGSSNGGKGTLRRIFFVFVVLLVLVVMFVIQAGANHFSIERGREEVVLKAESQAAELKDLEIAREKARLQSEVDSLKRNAIVQPLIISRPASRSLCGQVLEGSSLDLGSGCFAVRFSGSVTNMYGLGIRKIKAGTGSCTEPINLEQCLKMVNSDPSMLFEIEVADGGNVHIESR